MSHYLEKDDIDEFLNTFLFPAIYKGEIVLFLGAGASISSHKYLGAEIITYYQDRLGIDAETNDLIEFMDIIAPMKNFNRDDFDNYVVDLLDKLSPTQTHKTIASINWNKIITTNVDLTIEKAYDEIKNTIHENGQLKVIRNINEIYGIDGKNTIQYIKLNGCIKDKSKYPLIFSSKDFNFNHKFHRSMLKSLSSLSYDVKFMTVGYSFSDPFANYLIKHFDSFNFRARKTMYCIDPFISHSRLDYLESQGISVIKQTADDIFSKYTRWEENHSGEISKRKSIVFKSIQNDKIHIPSKLKLRLGDNVHQLTDDIPIKSFEADSFYKGEVPTYDIIRRNYDVIKKEKLKEVKNQLFETFNANGSKIIPVLFLTGVFGSGKSTFLYRLIHEILHEKSVQTVAFELNNVTTLKPTDLGELFSLTSAKNIIITCQEIELDSSFKELMDLRNRLSLQQFTSFNVHILVSIRENIFQKFSRRYQYNNIHELNIDKPLSKDEAFDLIDKLENANLLITRDNYEKNKLVNSVISDYAGDTFISLTSMLTNTSFSDILFSAYQQLSKTAREAFLYTSMLYQFKIRMPSALLMQLVSKDWTSFENDVLKYDSKNIIIQEVIDYQFNKDLYFRTRHPIISQNLIEKILKKDDERFDKIKKIVSTLIENDSNVTLFVDLLKAIRYNSYFDSEKVNKLFDIADKIFDIHPHFVIHYAINLQQRKTLSSFEKAIQKISHSESHLDTRNHYLTHRRAILNYQIAKIKYKEEKKELDKTYLYIDEAREYFEIKRKEDPFSSYSYIDYINLELWVLNKIQLEEKQLLLLHIKLQELFELADRTVFENTEKIIKLKSKYFLHLESNMMEENITIQQYLEDLYEKEESRPYSLVLRFNYINEKEFNIPPDELISEMEYYKFNDEVAKTLFTYYGRNLHISNNRKNFFDLVKGGYDFKNRDKLRFNFYSYIAESYNRNFRFSFEHIQEINKLEIILNPNLREVWVDENKSPISFTGIIMENKKGISIIKVIELQQSFALLKDSLKHFQPKLTEKFMCHLHFYIHGIRVELITKI